MSLKHKYIKLDDNNLELETFSLPSPREPSDQTSEIPDDFHQRFESYFQPYSQSQEHLFSPPQIEGSLITSDNERNSDTTFRYKNSFYESSEDYKSHNVFQRLWHGPEYIIDEPPTYSESSFFFKIDQFPRMVFQYRLSKSLRFIILFLLTFLQILIITIFFVWPYTNISDDTILPLECNSRLGFPSGVLNNKCGLNLAKCGFEYDHNAHLLTNPSVDVEDGAVVRCPALCDQGGLIYAPLAVGKERVR